MNKDASGLVDAGAACDLDDALLRGASGGNTMRSASSSASAVSLRPLWRVRCSSGSSDENMGSRASNDDDDDDDGDDGAGDDGDADGDGVGGARDEAKSPNSADGAV